MFFMWSFGGDISAKTPRTGQPNDCFDSGNLQAELRVLEKQ
jgi:hypothetical protein